MATPPANPEPDEPFEKRSGKKISRTAEAGNERADDSVVPWGESRRVEFTIVGVLLLTLIIGGWLILAGLI